MTDLSLGGRAGEMSVSEVGIRRFKGYIRVPFYIIQTNYSAFYTIKLTRSSQENLDLRVFSVSFFLKKEAF